MTRISATEAARNFSDILNRVRYRGERFEISRAGEVVARLEPVEKPRFTIADLDRLISEGPRLEPGDSKCWEEELKELRRAVGPAQYRWE